MNPGKLNHRIAIWHNAPMGGQNELGADEMAEQELCTCWARLEPRTGSLLSGRTADTMLSKTTHKVTIRYNSAVTYGCWIIYQGRRFDIDYISDPGFDKRYLELFVQEVV